MHPPALGCYRFACCFSVSVRLLAGPPLLAFGDDAPEESVCHAPSVGQALVNASNLISPKALSLTYARHASDVRPTCVRRVTAAKKEAYTIALEVPHGGGQTSKALRRAALPP